METTNERDLRVLSGLSDIMPSLRAYHATATALGLDDTDRQALDATVIRLYRACLLYTSPSPRDRTRSRMPSSA